MAGRGHYSQFYSTFTRLKCKKHAAAGFLIAINPFKIAENPDAINKDLPTVQRTQMKPEGETGMDRLKFMFKMDEYGDPSPELNMVSQATIMGAFTGSIIGGTIHSQESYLRFMERNQATQFYSHLDAKKRLQDKVFTGFFRGAWMWGWRLGLFTGTMTLVTTSISVYRGKSSVLEYMVGGTTAGLVYKFKSGPKAMVAGGTIGGLLGTMVGCVSLALMYLTGTSMEEIRYWQYKWKEEYQETKLNRLKQIREEDGDPYFKGRQQINVTDNVLQAIPEERDESNTNVTETVPQGKNKVDNAQE